MNDSAQRLQLLRHVGHPVHVEATVTRFSVVPSRDKEHYRTALLRDMTVEGSQAAFDHTWVRLGPTASERIDRYRLQDGVLIRFDAVVALYESQQQFKLGFSRLHNVEAFTQGRWRVLARAQERIETIRAARFDEGIIDSITGAMLMELQRPILERYAQVCPRKDKAGQALLARFFTRGMPVTDGQLAHAERYLRETT